MLKKTKTKTKTKTSKKKNCIIIIREIFNKQLPRYDIDVSANALFFIRSFLLIKIIGIY